MVYIFKKTCPWLSNELIVKIMFFIKFFLKLSLGQLVLTGLFVMAGLNLTACLSSSQKTYKMTISQKQVKKMDQAFALLKSRDFLNAGRIYDELAFSLTHPPSRVLMLFNAGVAYKSAGQCQKALLRFRKLLDQSLKNPSFKSRALLEISYTYQCLGKIESAFLSLTDLAKVRLSLPWELHQVVYPARLAIAYAQLGKRSQAEQSKSLVLARIIQSKTAFSSEKELNERMSRMFYLMGKSYMQKDHIQAVAFFKSFSYHQLFLLQSLFLDDKTWSRLSQEELTLLFDKLVFSLSHFKDKDKYKEFLLKSMEEGRALVQNEKSEKWKRFYAKISQPVLKLLSP